jgi:hypothetical protein
MDPGIKDKGVTIISLVAGGLTRGRRRETPGTAVK